MTPSETVNNWLLEISSDSGIALQLNEHGVCTFEYKKKLKCVLEAPVSASVLYLYAHLAEGPAPESPLADAYYARLLKSGFLGLETNGCAFAIDPDENQVVLQFNVHIDNLDRVQFSRLLGNFLETAFEWQCRLKEMNEDSPPVMPLLGGYMRV